MEKINVEQIMRQIQEEAAGCPAYEPPVEYESVRVKVVDSAVSSGKVYKFGRTVKSKCKALLGKFIRIFVAMYLFAKSQLAEGKNVILLNATKINELSAYVYNELEPKVDALEKENAELKRLLAEKITKQ